MMNPKARGATERAWMHAWNAVEGAASAGVRERLAEP